MKHIAFGQARIGVAMANPRAAITMARAIERAVSAAARAGAATSSSGAQVVRVRARKTVARLGAELTGAVAVVTVTTRNARHLCELVESLRAVRVAGVQVVWDGVDPERARVERHVFEVLERARSISGGPPVVLSREREPVSALWMLIALRQRKEESRS